MKKRKYNNILIVALLAVYVVYYRIFLTNSSMQSVEFINASAMLVLAFVSVLLLGFRRDKLTTKKKSILKITILTVLMFLGISYGLGFVTGFAKNTFNILTILDNIIAPILFITGLETFRYVVTNANRENKFIVYIVTFIITILELMMALEGAVVYDFETTFKIISTTVIPIIIKNMVMTYLASNGGLKPTLTYRYIMDLYGSVIPIIPDLGDYINSVIGILSPTLVYMYCSRAIESEEKEVEETPSKNQKTFSFWDIPTLIFVIVLVGLISGNFKYSIIGVGSGSMSPKIEKGDAVIYERIEKEQDIKTGDVLVFQSGSKIIIHRLVEVKKDSKGITYYVTKGDANNSKDAFNLTYDNIKGKVIFKIKYLAYPNLFLRDMIEKE